MSKSRIEIHLVRVEGVKQPESLSCHVFLYNKLFDVMAPLTHNNKENKTILPLGSLAAFSIKTLEKHSKTLYTTVFNTRLLQQQNHFWLPLYTTPQELKVISSDLTGPRLFLTIKNLEEEMTSCTPELSVTPEPACKDSRLVFEDLLHQKDQEIARLQEEIKSLKEQKTLEHVFEITNKNIDPVEIFLNVYLARNRLEGLIVKHKGNLYKHGSNFVEVSLKDNKLCCRTESTWIPLEDFLSTRCSKEIESLLENRAVPRSALASRNSSPKRYSRRSENLEVEDPKHRRSESFKKLLKPTLSVLNKNVRTVQTKKSPFRC